MTRTLRESWPEAFIVRIVRDPRDVALSLAGMPFAKDSVVGNLVRVDSDDRASRELIEADPRAMTLRYEDLVTEPERELRRVCAFIGEQYAPAVLDSRGTAPSVAADEALITVDEGETATNDGIFSDPGDDIVTVGAVY